MINEKKQRYVKQHASAGRVSRRSFLSSLGAAGVVATAGSGCSRGVHSATHGADDGRHYR